MADLSSTHNPGMFAEQWQVRWQDFIPAAGLVLAMGLAWLAHRNLGGMTPWGVSAAAIRQGRLETIALHMFAHGGAFHLILNSLALLEVGGLLTARLGGFPKGWARLLAAYGLAGLSSMVFFLLVHPYGKTPMIGASGAIYGLVGLLLGIRLIEELEPVAMKRLPEALLIFIEHNLVFLVLLIVAGALAGTGSRVAWEAHAGGFLLGLAVSPWLLPHAK